MTSAIHLDVPESELTLFCCWLVRGSLGYRPSPNEHLFIECPAPLAHTRVLSSVTPSHEEPQARPFAPRPLTSLCLGPAAVASHPGSLRCYLLRPLYRAHPPAGDLSFLA